MELLEGNRFVDAIAPVRRQSLSDVLAGWRLLRGLRADIAIDFQGLFKSALVASMARPDRIYGFHVSELRERVAALFYSSYVQTHSAHVVDKNLELAQAIGAANLLRAFPLPSGRLEGELPSGPYVISNPLAGWGSKQWPLENYKQLALMLQDQLGLTLVLNGPPQARAVLSSVPGGWPHISGISGLICATRTATAVVGLDSGPLHLAAALGKPGVGMFGPTDPGRNGPYGDTITVLRDAAAETSYKRRSQADTSMVGITPEAVFRALEERLA
jgi:heptosyltransferase-1